MLDRGMLFRSMFGALLLGLALEVLPCETTRTACAQNAGLSIWDRPDPWRGDPPSFDPFDEVVVAGEVPVEAFKRGFFQRLDFEGGWTIPFDNDFETQFGQTGVAVAVPLGSLENILVINPTFRFEHWKSNLTIDTPEELYQVGVNFLNIRQWNDRISTFVLVQPTMRSDFRGPDPPIRFFGVGMVQYEWIPDILQVSGGVVHLGRDDISPILPAAGLVWTPNPYWRFDLQAPRPRVAYRIAKEGELSETWTYVAGSFGGTTWDVKRASGAIDQVSTRDFGVMIGVERIVSGGGGAFLQAGLHLGRRLEYRIGNEQVDLSNGWSIQGGVRF